MTARSFVLGLLLLGPAACGPERRPVSATESPLDPAQAGASLSISPGFTIGLAAAEPDVVDPVAMAFDERGRLYVAEMPGYPNHDTAEGDAAIRGRIRLLENPDSAGRFRKSRIFVDGLNFPSTLMPYKKGLLVGCAPDLLYFEDSDGDGRADVRRVLYTGFGRRLIEALVNGLQWGLDNWVYALGSTNGGEIRSVEKPEAPVVSLHGRGFRFHPDIPGSLEPILTGGQFGLAADDWGRWFTCTNGEHLRHIVLTGGTAARDAFVPSPPALVDVPDHGAACKLFRTSPLEAWRVERTARRAGSADAARMRSTELLPGGYVTSACGLAVWKDEVFVCDPANNVVHRDLLAPKGVTFSARRAPGEEEREFLASTDPWWRPVNLAVGPDGALYVADFYRQVIEGMTFIPADIREKQHLNVQSGGQGRIWRIVRGAPAAARTPPSTVEDWVGCLEDPSGWWRLTAQRVLVQDLRKDAIPALQALLARSGSPLARMHALWTLQGLGALDSERAERALGDADPGVREQAIRMWGSNTVMARVEDPSPRVRFQAAFALGALRGNRKLDALVRLGQRDGADPYLRTAILASAGDDALELHRRSVGAPDPFLQDLSALIGARLNPSEIAELVTRATGKDPEARRAAILNGLGEGLRQRRQKHLDVPAARAPLKQLLTDPSEPVRKAAAGLAAHLRTLSDEELRDALGKALAVAPDESKEVGERTTAARMLGSGEFAAVGETLRKLLDPRHPEPVQIAALESIDALSDPGVVRLLVDSWRRLLPPMRERAVGVLMGRKDRLVPFLEAVEKGEVPPDQVDGLRRAQLLSFPDPEIAERAKRTFKPAPLDPKLFDAFKGALDLSGDAARGAASFKKLCMACHRAGGQGTAIGPNLASVRENPPDQVLRNILYPSLVVAPSFVQYVVETADGQVLNGIIAEAGGTGITLRRPNAEDVRLLRKDIRNLVSSQVSLMPEDLLKGLSPQDVADLLEFVRGIQ